MLFIVKVLRFGLVGSDNNPEVSVNMHGSMKYSCLVIMLANVEFLYSNSIIAYSTGFTVVYGENVKGSHYVMSNLSIISIVSICPPCILVSQ